MNNEHWITAIDRSFQRVLRWIYPGILFFLLLYVSNYAAFKKVGDSLGFPANNVWGVLIGSFAIGSVLYLLQQYVINELISLVVCWFNKRSKIRTCFNWLNKCSKIRTCFKWAGDFFDFEKQAKKAAARYATRAERNGYMDYAWGVHHALVLTGYLIIAFEFIDSNSHIYDQIPSLSLWFASAFVIFGFILNAKLRVYGGILFPLSSMDIDY